VACDNESVLVKGEDLEGKRASHDAGHGEIQRPMAAARLGDAPQGKAVLATRNGEGTSLRACFETV
jgi:hypothetical protein